jgi:hypothetical protein
VPGAPSFRAFGFAKGWEIDALSLTRARVRRYEVVTDVRDAASVLEVVQHTKPDVIVNELTSLPKHYTPEEMKAAAERDKEVRVKGNANLLAAARATNCRRYVLQSSAFWYAPGAGLADETASFAFAASPGIAAGWYLLWRSVKLSDNRIDKLRDVVNKAAGDYVLVDHHRLVQHCGPRIGHVFHNRPITRRLPTFGQLRA